MKSDKRLDKEIEAVGDILNNKLGEDVHTPEMRIALAIYYALRWARGRNELWPSKYLEGEILKMKEKSS